MAQLTMPNVGEGVTEGTVTRWLKHAGDSVALDEPIVEVETDKAVVEIPSPFAGAVTAILVEEGAVVPIGAALCEVTETAEASTGATEDMPSEQPAASAPAVAQPPPTPTAAASVPATAANGATNGDYPRTRRYSPVVARLASEHSIDLTLVRGTGIEGRVTRQDVERYIANPAANTVPAAASAGVVGVDRAPSAPAPPRSGEHDLTPLSATRRTIAAHMTESHQTIPVAWMMLEADVTDLVAYRERTKEQFESREGVRLTFLPLFVEAIVAALKEHPALNATYSDAGIQRHPDIHAGIAVATPSGLVVPVVRNAGDLSISGLAKEIARLGEKAQRRKLTLEELKGATFTIDNTGSFGSIASKPIVPVGQVAIITTEAIRRELRPVGDLFGVRSVMNLCISFDHRALDGAEAGEFMQAVKRRLERAPE